MGSLLLSVCLPVALSRTGFSEPCFYWAQKSGPESGGLATLLQGIILYASHDKRDFFGMEKAMSGALESDSFPAVESFSH